MQMFQRLMVITSLALMMQAYSAEQGNQYNSGRVRSHKREKVCSDDEIAKLNKRLLDAAGKSDLGAVRVALEDGADVDAQTPHGMNALMKAIYNGDTEMVYYLLGQKANIHLETQSSDDPLLLASQFGYIEIVKMLLEKNADVNAQDQNGHTPLALAVKRGHSGIIDLLTARGATINPRREYDDNESAEFKTVYAENKPQAVAYCLRSGLHVRDIRYPADDCCLRIMSGRPKSCGMAVSEQCYRSSNRHVQQESLHIKNNEPRRNYSAQPLALKGSRAARLSLLSNKQRNLSSLATKAVGATVLFAALRAVQE